MEITTEAVARVDKSDMLGTIYAFPGQVERALRATQVPSFNYQGQFDKVLLTGLGGSAIGADYLTHWAATESRFPLVVNRDYQIPKWVDARTLVVTISMSGGTEETLAAFGEARARGAKIVAVSTGGKMKEFCQKTNTPFIEVEGGMQPRAAVGRMLVADALALEAAGVLQTRAALEKAVTTLKAMQQEYDPKGPANRNPAKQLALQLGDTIPVVYASGHLVPVARRFANQLNENSKILAFWGAMPEMNHNELVGWSGDAQPNRFTAVLLRSDLEHPGNAKRFEYTANLMREWGANVVEIKARGTTVAEQLLTTTYHADLVSGYLAVLRGQDPTPVQPISGLKEALGKLGIVEKAERSL